MATYLLIIEPNGSAGRSSNEARSADGGGQQQSRRVMDFESTNSDWFPNVLVAVVGKHVEKVGESDNGTLAAYCSLPMRGLEKNDVGDIVLDALDFNHDDFSVQDLSGPIIICGPNQTGLSKHQIQALSWLATYAESHPNITSLELKEIGSERYPSLWE